MPTRLLIALAGAALAMLAAPFAAAQPAAARASAGVDLPARFAEVRADAKLTDTLSRTGRKVAAVCANCHGEGGNSIKPDIPNLAGQNPAYLLEQVQKFADGRRRNPFMEGMIKAMSADEKIGMVLFYSSQSVTRTPPSNAPLVAKGAEYFGKVCFRCHGTDGRGNDKIARIAGQQADYLRLTLKRYRAGTGERIDPLMAANTRLMTDADIDSVVAYVNAME